MPMKQTDPIFIAEFENGHQTCTAVFCPPTSSIQRAGCSLRGGLSSG
jgi:hypothetical protein